ncbi:dihydropteroate synthase [Tatlockia micdadei]|nr:dihydropteroate synthase [Legionella micdadei]NSL18077.1 dihydropteroate synthase [Legionella micdadei]
MGVLNVTPDSFSDGGRYYQIEQAIEYAHQMISEGADIIDVGGESSKPGALPVSCDEELERVIPVIKQLRKESDVCISIDTTKAQVMHEAINTGASIINDIAGFRSEEALAMAVKLDVPLCLMHMQGEPQDMQHNPLYRHDVVDEINFFFQQRIERCVAAGVKRKNIILDPGFGFGKTPQHNMRIVNQISKFKQHNLPVMLGVSRKSTLGIILNTPVDRRLAGGLAIAVFSALHGVAMIRTHDVAETHQALTMVQAIKAAG